MLHLSAANRRMVRLAVRERDREAAALLHRRQRLIDIDCFARLLDEGKILAALKHAHLGGPARLLRHVRAAAGAVRRRFKGLPSALPGLSTPVQGMDVGRLCKRAPPRISHRESSS